MIKTIIFFLSISGHLAFAQGLCYELFLNSKRQTIIQPLHFSGKFNNPEMGDLLQRKVQEAEALGNYNVIEFSELAANARMEYMGAIPFNNNLYTQETLTFIKRNPVMISLVGLVLSPSNPNNYWSANVELVNLLMTRASRERGSEPVLLAEAIDGISFDVVYEVLARARYYYANAKDAEGKLDDMRMHDISHFITFAIMNIHPETRVILQFIVDFNREVRTAVKKYVARYGDETKSLVSILEWAAYYELGSSPDVTNYLSSGLANSTYTSSKSRIFVADYKKVVLPRTSSAWHKFFLETLRESSYDGDASAVIANYKMAIRELAKKGHYNRSGIDLSELNLEKLDEKLEFINSLLDEVPTKLRAPTLEDYERAADVFMKYLPEEYIEP